MKKNAKKTKDQDPTAYRQLTLRLAAVVRRNLYEIVIRERIKALDEILEQDRERLCGPAHGKGMPGEPVRWGRTEGRLVMAARGYWSASPACGSRARRRVCPPGSISPIRTPSTSRPSSSWYSVCRPAVTAARSSPCHRSCGRTGPLRAPPAVASSGPPGAGSRTGRSGI